MTGDTAAGVAGFVLLLTLPLSALLARRIRPGKLVLMALIWAVLIGGTVAVVTLARHAFGRQAAPAPSPTDRLILHNIYYRDR